MTFQPIWPWWIIGPVILASLALLGWTAVRPASRAAASRGAASKAGATRRAWLLPAALVGLLLLAAVRPGVSGGSVRAAAADLNVFFVVDTTSSIAAEDYGNGGTRLDGVRKDIMAIAAELAGARFSLVTFDSQAVVRMPLTTDASALDTLTAVLEPQVTVYSTGSSVTVARTVLNERLKAARDSHPERPRIVYYLGDGEQTSGKQPEPIRVDESLVNGGAVLGYGTAEGGRMKEKASYSADGGASYIQDRSGGSTGDAVSRIDEDKLREIAAQLGVPYVHRTAADAVAPMMQAAKPGALKDTSESLEGRVELYWAPALAAFVLALWESLRVLRQLRQLKPAKKEASA
ncbi:VWA domain-containing protein [Arthrobacter sp. 24S4-2]|uniref:VWA domain-containing protein n=1 Tax=Arthrobacter sp. 24S4-2 TaxID=2575374 RepID=UPI0010C797EC|nr:vWA domain-containing protein [Arthrobacter sp. 24S4-2]QCO98867.1 VWA domain-containing protein [Arthrobacter sp. 24S4-2]